jgi:hypothetical protein
LKKAALIKTDYEEGGLQPTPADYPQLATPRANYSLLVLFWASGSEGAKALCPHHLDILPFRSVTLRHIKLMLSSSLNARHMGILAYLYNVTKKQFSLRPERLS